MNTLLIGAHLKRLKLPAIAKNYEKLARDAEVSNQTYDGYLLALLDHEINQRDQNLQAARIRQAKFPFVKTLEQFDFSEVPAVSPARILSLAQSDWVDQGHNLIMVGHPGLGKTHLAIGLGIAACRRGKRVRFVTTSGLVNDLAEARANSQLSRLQAYYNRVDLLILDELGFVPFPKDGAEMLFNLCAGRYERKSTLVTTNLEFSRWTEVMGDQTLAGAMVDRLTHHAQIIKLTGESYRFRESLRRTTRGAAPSETSEELSSAKS